MCYSSICVLLLSVTELIFFGRVQPGRKSEETAREQESQREREKERERKKVESRETLYSYFFYN